FLFFSFQTLATILSGGYSLGYRLQLLLRPLKVLLHSGPVRRRLLLEISVTSVGIEKRKLLLNHANNAVERFRQRVTLLFANLAVGVVTAFLLEQLGGGLNLRPLQLNQVGQRKRLGAHRQNQRASGNNRLHRETFRGSSLHRLVISARLSYRPNPAS